MSSIRRIEQAASHVLGRILLQNKIGGECPSPLTQAIPIPPHTESSSTHIGDLEHVKYSWSHWDPPSTHMRDVLIFAPFPPNIHTLSFSFFLKATSQILGLELWGKYSGLK